MRLIATGVALLLLVLYIHNPADAWTHSWHTGAINCYNCSNAEDCAAGAGALKKCEQNDAQNCLALFDNDGNVIRRGCSDEFLASCKVNDCHECRSHGCNNLKDKSKLIECVVCDAALNENCVFDEELITDTRLCNEQCITALYPRTKDAGSPLELVRTCLDDLNYDERQACADGTMENCVACTTAKCNRADMGVRGTCNVCSGGNCANPQSKTCRAVVAAGTIEQCFIQVDESNQISEMGCLSQYNLTDVELLKASKRLWTCEGESCNVASALPTTKRCTLCNSRTDPKCATSPTLTTSTTECRNPINSDCYTLLREDGHTERGCLTTLDSEDYLACREGHNATKCVTCQGDRCNVKLQPEQRLSCHVCDSSEDPSCSKSPAASELCVLHQPNQLCISTLDEWGNTLRGCSGSLSCASSNCHSCEGSNCNVVNLERRIDGQPGQWGQELPLSCQSCNDTAACAAATITELKCSGKDEYCMTVFDASGKVETRGCSQFVESKFSSYCDENEDKCLNCNSNNCNNAKSLSDYTACIFCDTTENGNCIADAELVTTRRHCNGQCMTALRYRNNGSDVYDLVRGCLDDKEPAEQQSCAAGNDEECRACSGEACNVDNLKLDWNVCYVCTDSEDCVDDTSAVCLHYSATDRCYTLYDEEASVQRKGCVSALDESFIEKNLEWLYFCSGDNCNSYKNQPGSNLCAVCSSLDDPNCAVDPSQIKDYETCSLLPHTGCMTRVLSSGFTERGCVSKLSGSSLVGCLQDGGNCDVCTGDMCNRDIYPADRRRCQRCNSNNDASCGSSSPSALSVCPHYDESQGCSVKLVKGVTYRGCQTEFICDDTDKQYCRNCQGDNCNVVDLNLWNIGYPGKWTTPPINCYTCEGIDCQGSSSGPLQKCSNNNDQNCATVFASNGSVILRSCTDRLYANAELMQHCDSSPDSCKFCKSTGCNNAKTLDNYVDCLMCDGPDNAACVRNLGEISRTRSCQGSCFTGLYKRNRTDVDTALELSRGCLDDLEYDNRQACADGTLENCVACSGAACNKDAVPAKRLSCNHCADANCEKLEPLTCISYREEDQCYIHVGDKRIESMGCASDLEQRFLTANRRDLYLCDSDNCNVKDVLKLEGLSCKYCNSSSEPNCIVGESIRDPVCQHYLTPDCYTHITADGVVERGCVMDLPDDLYDSCTSGSSADCETCDSNGCNKNVFPANWKRCLRCDSAKDANCEKLPTEYANYCPIYEASDSCVTSLENGRTRRGCSTEIQCDVSQPGNCRVCEAENCNSVNLAGSYVGEPGKWQDLPLSCLVCSDAASCATVTEPTKCSGNHKQLCTTVFDSAGSVVARGCSDDILTTHAATCEASEERCPLCKSNGCNNAKSLSDYVECYQCDAEEDGSNCIYEVLTSRKRRCQGQCMTGMYPRSSSPDTALLPTRGCLDDLELEDRQLCAAGNHQSCKACTGALCNTEILVDPPQECYTCTSQDCMDMSVARCVSYKEELQCYTAYDENDVVAMGCASDFETLVINELVAQKRLSICSGKNCNQQMATPNTCLKCSSLNDPRCATNPNQLQTTEICAQFPYTECVTHVSADGVTTRDCLSQLDNPDFYSCLMGSSAHCEVCKGSNCNGLSVFPADRRRCHQCDSSTDPNCESSPNSPTVCPIYADEDTCVTTIRNDITYRGCGTSLKCDDPTDSGTCRICSDKDGCNTVDLARLHTHGNPGTWQPTPISCLSCNSIAGCTNGGGSSQTCSGKDNCVTVFDASGAVSSRGCYSQLDSTNTNYCDEQPEKCPRCNSNGCNLADALSSYMECLVCDSSTNPNCVQDVSKITRTRQCYKGCMTAFRELFQEETNPSYALVRNCHDDMEVADRDSCSSGTNKLCSTCNEDKCNKNDLVQQRHSCLSCSGNGCQNPQPASCSNYRESDQCYIQFDETRSIVYQGCLSEFSHEDIYLLQRAKRLVTCEEKDCNSVEQLPDPQACVLCNSRTDPACAVKPEGVTSATDCQLMGLPECYSRVLTDGSTERGCLSSLESDQFLACYNGTATDCASCLGDSCNNQLYPVKRTSCHICNSESNGKCESDPDSLSICPIYAAEDSCVTNLRNGITYRGCASSISCEPNSKSCIYCEGDGCNVADLSVHNDDNHGKWQDLPLSCLSCKDEASCQQPNLGTPERCVDNNLQDCVTVFNEAGAVIRRGCEDTIDEEQDIASYCASNAAKCPICKSNNCNNATATTQYNSCIYCDSAKDIDCLWYPTNAKHKRRQCQGDCMSALHGSDETGWDIIRTCLDDKDAADQLTCLSGKDAKCEACTGATCNVEFLPKDRISCYHCQGGDCESPSPKLCDIYKPDDSCYLWVNAENSIEQLGCLSAFRNQDVESIIKTKRISVCQGNNCNVPQLPASVKCAVCDSRVNATCATSPTAIDNFEVCGQMPYPQCWTRVDNEGATTRGCLYDLPQSNFADCLLGKDELCQICGEDGCNREIYPADRQRCYSCSSADDSKCESDPSQSQVCPWLSATETCQTRLDSNVTTRGCSSVISCDGADFKNCRNCRGSECNAIDLANRKDDGLHGLFQTLPLKCHSCQGEQCLSSLGPAETCTLNVAQDCKTVFEADGQTVRRRGCSDDVDDYEDRYCRQHPELCFVCKSNECNDAWKVTDYTSCLSCSSESAAECVTYPQSNEVGSRSCQGKCMVALLENKQLVRGCLNDKELFDQTDCSSDESGKNCATCENGDCNTFAFPKDRLSCHVCSGADCTASAAQQCVAYDDQDYCFAMYKDGKPSLMGCASSQNETDLEQWRLSNTLFECRGADCNGYDRLPASGVCLSCDSSKTPNCAQSPTDVTSTITCHAPLADCLIRIENGHTIRGCLSSLSSTDGEACKANGTCSVCSGEKCNVEVFPVNRRKCHICNSSANANCNEQPDHLAICPIYAADDTCVSAYGSDKFLQRGCGSELTCEIDDKDHCQTCNTDGCNTAKFNGAATLSGIGLVLTLLVSFAISGNR